jgi:choline dehydrogenase-like flavoprotein
MSESGVNRRDFFFGLAGATAGAWLAAHGSELRVIAAYAASVAPEQAYEFFTPEQARDHDAISAQIVPTDDRPGAREAHVVRFADRYYATVFKNAQPVVRNDFKLLGDAVAEKTPGSRSFAALSDADQIAFLTAFEKANPASFNHFRGITMLGMFSDPIHGGNFNKVGWKLVGFEDRYSWAPPFGYYDRESSKIETRGRPTSDIKTVPDHEHHQAAAPASLRSMKTYRPTDEVDFVIVGSGAAGGVMAHELARSGFSVVVLEQGSWLTEKDFSHDPLNDRYHPEKSLSQTADQPQTRRANEAETAKKGDYISYGRLVGGGTVHFTGNYWRFPEIEFEQATRLGVPDGSSVADWPITYKDLEPYYTKVDWEIGVCGKAGYPFEPWRSKGYPVPPLPIKSEGVLCERGAKKLGWHAWPAPMAILSRPYRGRATCVACGPCGGYGCEVRAKSSTLVAMIPGAVATSRCEIRPNSYVRRIEMGPNGRVTGVTYFDKDKKDVFQRAKAVVLSANGVETPKLLLLSATGAFPDGLANSSGQVGRNLMSNGGGRAFALFDQDVNGWKGADVSRVIWDFFEVPRELGLYGGGGLDMRSGHDPGGGSWPGEPTWGREWKKRARDYFTKNVQALAHTTQLPVSNNRIDLDPVEKDAWGLSVPRITFTGHPLDTKLSQFFNDRARELLQAAGAAKLSAPRVASAATFGGEHLLGTCRMGKDPKTSVIDADHRAHDVPNLFIVDGSSFVTSGRGQPTLTIQALAFRAAERIARLAKAGSI